MKSTKARDLTTVDVGVPSFAFLVDTHGRTAGELRSMDAHTAEIAFTPDTTAPCLRLGEPVQLEVASDIPESRRQIPCVVQARFDGHGVRRYRVAFRTYLDQRLHPRSAPRRDERIDVAITVDERCIGLVGRLRDISLEGLSVTVPSNAERLVAAIEEMGFAFLLPGDTKRRGVRGRICNRRLEAGEVVYGIEFRPTGSSDEQQALRRAIRAFLETHP